MDKSKACGGHALRIAVGITILVLLLAGGVEAVTPISSCTTISSPGEYVLDQSILDSGASSCINITSNNIIFDGADYTIDGIDAANSYGVYVYNSTKVLTNVTVKNLNLTDWYDGIYYKHTQNGSIVKINASSNNYSIYLEYSSNNTLSGNNANSNNNFGIDLEYSTNNNLTGNNASNNGIVGIWLYSSTNNNLTGNNASNNKDGIHLYYSSNNNTLSGNTANSNTLWGIYLEYSTNNNLTGNNANTNKIDGIRLSPSSNNNLTGNNANSNTQSGIYLSSSTNNNLTSNTANSNTQRGIYLSSSSNNTLIDNNANSNNLDGIYLYYYSNNNTLSNNTANSNTENGIYLWSSSNNNTMTGNNVSNNGVGVLLRSSSNNNTLAGNNVSNNNAGIDLWFSSNNNTLSNNTVNFNTLSSIYLSSSSNNNIYNNIFNTNFYLDSNINIWNTTKTSGTNIIGGPNLGGNFWADPSGTGFSQTCADTDRDYICDSNYILASGNVDYLPLSMPPQPPGYINGTVLNNGVGIVGVDVITNTTISTTTDSSGFYSLLVPPGAYDLTATKEPQYYPNSSVKVTVVTGTTLIQNIELLKKPNISACTMISSPGEYVLDQNIPNSGASSCINITSSNVILDGAGYTIDGIDATNSYGVYVYNSTTVLTNVTVKNLNVTDWQNGIYYKNTRNGSIAKNNALSNDYGIYLSNSNNSTVSSNTASNNWNSSTNNGGYGIFLSYSSNNTVRENNANSNHRNGVSYQGNGIFLSSASNNTLTSNNASGNWCGISLDHDSNNNTVNGNNVSNSNYWGMELSYSNYNTIVDNNASKNLDGIYVSRSNNNTLSGNNASLNGDEGILLGFSNNNTLSGNTANSNGNRPDTTGPENIRLVNSNNNTLIGNKASNSRYGIYFQFSVNNTVRENNANSNAYCGIYVSSYSNYNTIIDNNASNNQNGYSIHVSSYSNYNMIIDNKASNNYYGIYLEGNSYYNTIVENNASNNVYGINLSSSSYNMIIDNNASNFYLKSSSNNTIVDNNDNSNNRPSISLESSSNNNILYKNNFNSSVADNSINNKWDNSKDIGNHYSNYDQPTEGCEDGVSAPKDGVCDLPYTIPGTSGSRDNYPLTTSGEPVNSSTGNGITYFDSGTSTIEDLASVDVNDIPEPPPTDANLYYGLFKFNITDVPNDGNAILTLTFPDNLPDSITYWKYGATVTNPTPHWYIIPSIINGNKLTITLTDGGLGDDDLTTNGRIKDDGGPSIPQGYINGTVFNNSIGISGAIVSINGSIMVTADSSGFYSVLMLAGDYYLTATREPRFYPNSSINVTVVGGPTLVQDIELLKKPTGNISGSVSAN